MRYWLALLICLLPQLACAQVTVDATATVVNSGGNTTVQQTLTTGGAATIIIGALQLNNVAQAGFGTPTSVTMSWNQSPMTLVSSTNGQAGTLYAFCYIFAINSPATGAHVLSSSWTGTNQIALNGISFKGSAASLPIGSTNTGTSATSSITVNNVPANDMAIALFGDVNGQSYNAGGQGAGNTSWFANNAGGGSNDAGAYQSGSGNITLSYSMAASDTFCAAAADISGGGATPLRTLLGVGQ